MSINLDFRPASYTDFDDPVSLVTNGIKGQMRREMARDMLTACLLYTSPSPRDRTRSRMPSSA